MTTLMGSWIETMRILIDNPQAPWPNYNCVCGSLLFAPLARLCEPDDVFVVVFGRVNEFSHCWIETFDYYVDISIGQFKHIGWPKDYGIISKPHAEHLGFRVEERLSVKHEAILREAVSLAVSSAGTWRNLHMPLSGDAFKRMDSGLLEWIDGLDGELD